MFDKAEPAKQQEEAEQHLQSEIQALEGQLKSAKGNDKQQLQALISQKRNQLAALATLKREAHGNGQDVAEQRAEADVTHRAP